MPLMKTARAWLDAYGESHQHPVNERIHWVCVPAIMLSLVALLSLIPDPFPGAHWGTVLVVGATLYYATLSVPLAIGMAFIGLALLAAVPALAAIPIPLSSSALVIFALAWVGQFIGHKIEGKKPSFFQDLQFLLIGPMWLLSHLYRAIGIRY